MTISIDVEDDAWLALPGLETLAKSAVGAALFAAKLDVERCEVAVLFTDDAAIAAINAEWRGKDRPTNVLSFPAPEDMPVPAGEPRPLGDIVLAHGVISREAAEQGKTLHDHSAHLIVHGTLHLLGHDHEDEAEAEAMEALETSILKGLGISDPYERD
jgi:probable rRNA maturation factor